MVMKMINEFEKLIDDLLSLTPRKDEPEFLMVRPREQLTKKIRRLNSPEID